MKLSVKNPSKKFKNMFKYILQIQNIKYKFSESHIYFDEKDELQVKETQKYLLKTFLPKIITQIVSKTITINNKLPVLTISYFLSGSNLILTGTVMDIGSSSISVCGFNIYYVYTGVDTNSTTNINPQTFTSTLNSHNIFSGTFNIIGNCSNLIGNPQMYVLNYQAFATNNSGTQYTNFYAYRLFIECLVENTYITLFDGTKKYIQDITYDDLLLVWDFDNCKFTYSRPLWIKTPQETNEYYCAIFDDGRELKFVNKHRIYNNKKEKFTNLFKSEKISTRTEDESCINLLKINVIKEKIKYYNIITDYHMNFYANGILTSCRYNNLYPIKNMKFIKIDNNNLFNLDFLPQKYIDGMRLKEQNIANTVEYINRLIVLEKRTSELFKHKKILFLDHGGVMTKNTDFDIKNINYIREIVNNFCLPIVISSDWTETQTFEEIKTLYKKYNINVPFDYTHKKKYTSHNNFPNISYNEIRAGEILEWIKEKNYKINEIIIIDDLDLRKYFTPDIFLWIQKGLLCDNL
jgi:hypothetical protein